MGEDEIISKQENSKLFFFRLCLKIQLCEKGCLKHFHTIFFGNYGFQMVLIAYPIRKIMLSTHTN